MTKADLIAVIEKQANLPHHQAEKIVNICFDSMIQALFDDERIEIRGFGSFANRNYKAYEGRNPKTGKVVKVSPKKVPFFKVGKELKEMVDEGKDDPKCSQSILLFFSRHSSLNRVGSLIFIILYDTVQSPALTLIIF